MKMMGISVTGDRQHLLQLEPILARHPDVEDENKGERARQSPSL